MFAPILPLAQAIPVPPAQQVILPPEVPAQADELLNPPPPRIPPKVVMQTQEVRPLPGQLDSIPVFNSNSPEMVQTEGILLSTFPSQGKQTPSAHLNFPFKGRFDIFSHHIVKAKTTQQTRTLYQGIIAYNPNSQPVNLDVLQAVSYLTRPDALFVSLPSYLENPLGTVFAGPGSRVTNDVLRGRRQDSFPAAMEIPAGRSQMLINLPIPVGNVTPSSNGRTTLMRLSSSNSLYIATLAMFAPLDAKGKEQFPTLEQWEKLLKSGRLAGPRDLAPTLPGLASPRVIYGRVAGVAEGSQWLARVTDNPKVDYLSVPQRGKAFSYALSTTYTGTFGTGQIQSAKMLARYPDTAYYAHGNYGVQYSLTFPLYNPEKQAKTISIEMQTPVKANKQAEGLMFYDPPDNRVFFRGTVRVLYNDDRGATQNRYIHIIQRRGQQGEPLVTLNMKPGERRAVQVEFLYPPDATPPQVLTLRSSG
ncbi:DUF3370 domain-containing protein [Kamptonema animale CS-326]|jgi:hypothetical protein|uniref:DUF3370 domain-containing protein n=1 Tax=Kamptonema animale TaxID=92934 RepID=UPI00232B0EA7|nr:DUF3370 domain-containing protein [Kamptonema animale]MDB9514306.1 DUF3370 domain-containing protein [Kamptonema animale CS-326]